MLNLDEATLAAIGRMTVAATDLEHLLAWIGADQAGGDADAIFAKPGEPLHAARGSVQFVAPPMREEIVAAVEAAGVRLAVSQTALRRLWTDEHPVDPAVFDDLTADLVRCRDWLHDFLQVHLGVSVV